MVEQMFSVQCCHSDGTASAKFNIKALKLLIVLEEDYGCSLVCVHVAF